MDDGRASRDLENDQTGESGGGPVRDHAGSADRSGHRPKLVAGPVTPAVCRLNERLAQDRMSSLGVLAASIARELSTPLTYVTVHLQTLAAELCRAAARDAPPDWQPLSKDELAERALLGVAGTQRMRDVVRHISAFSRFREEARLTEVNVATALDLAVEMGHSEHVLRVRVVKRCNDVPDVEANPEQLAHALLSLLIAAAHSCEESDPKEHELRVLIRQEEGNVVVEVGNGRRGPHTRRGDEALDPFPSVRSEGTGSGLGLSLCATVITSFAGQVLVGRGGGRFVVRLPCASRTTDGPASAPPAKAQRFRTSRRAHILVVGSEPQVSGVVAELLRAHAVDRVASALEAQAWIETGDHFEVILSEVAMPHMTGMDLHAWLADHHPQKASRMAFMSREAISSQTREFLDRSGAHCLLEPFDAAELHQVIDDLVASSKLPCAAVCQPS